jgi:hypothetical protein
MSNEPLTTDAEREFDKIAAYGSNLEAIGKAMQNPDTTLFELVDLAFAAGNGIGISFISLTPDQPE